jgi:hypothetical protein
MLIIYYLGLVFQLRKSDQHDGVHISDLWMKGMCAISLGLSSINPHRRQAVPCVFIELSFSGP